MICSNLLLGNVGWKAPYIITEETETQQISLISFDTILW